MLPVDYFPGLFMPLTSTCYALLVSWLSLLVRGFKHVLFLPFFFPAAARCIRSLNHTPCTLQGLRLLLRALLILQWVIVLWWPWSVLPFPVSKDCY